MYYSWNIVGHQQQLQQLEYDIQKKNVGHAYLFSGPAQTGKFRIAKAFAQILQCTRGFCKTCKDCKQILLGSHADTVLLPDDGDSLKIDQIRALIAQANLTAYGTYRIIVIENIERMSIEAQNSLLKILEEPPGRTIFLLTTKQIDRILPTIRSRVRHHTFFNVSDAILRQFLKKEFGTHQPIDEVVNMAQGRPGLAIALLNDADLLSQQRDLYGRIEGFLKRNDVAKKFAFVEELVEDENALELFFDAFSRYLRKLLFEYVEQKNPLLNTRLTLADIVNLFESLEKTRYLVERNVNKKLALENFLLQTEQ